MKTLLILVAALGALAVPAAARADALVAPAPGATGLTAGGGYLAWLEQTPGTTPGSVAWRLVVRRPDGTVTRPQVEPFGVSVPLSIGSTGVVDPTRRDVSVIYTRGNDLHRLDLVTGRESRVGAVSSRAYQEVAGVARYGAYTFVRRGGRRPGIYRHRPRAGASVRIVSATPSILDATGSRVAYASGTSVVVRRVSGEGQVIRFRSPTLVRDVVLTRYRIMWLTKDGRVFQSERFGGSTGPDDTVVAREGRRRLPATTTSIAGNGSSVTRYLDAEGVKSISPPLF
jgi:hypothetical protein